MVRVITILKYIMSSLYFSIAILFGNGQILLSLGILTFSFYTGYNHNCG